MKKNRIQSSVLRLFVVGLSIGLSFSKISLFAQDMGILPTRGAPKLAGEGLVHALPVVEPPQAGVLDGASVSDPVWVKAMQGYGQFRKWMRNPENKELVQLLKRTQEPKIMAIGCVDSRGPLELLLQARPGDIFAVRNIANMVPAEQDVGHHATSSALEYGINVLKVEHLILLGHSSCGGIKGLLTGIKGDMFITNWVSQMKSILPAGYKQNENVSYAVVDEYAKKALQKSYENCMNYPFVKQAVDDKKLVVHVWFFDINKGTIFMYDKQTKQWAELTENALNEFLRARGQ